MQFSSCKGNSDGKRNQRRVIQQVKEVLDSKTTGLASMVTITSQLNVSEAVANRARKCFVRKASLTSYIVKPKLHGKTRRLVTFTLRRGNRLTADCRNYYQPFEGCPANRWGVLCYHAVAALRRLEINSRREVKAA
jgi:hypothetical protein